MTIIDRIKRFFENRKIKRLESKKDAEYRRECLSDGRKNEYDAYLYRKNRAYSDIKRMQGYIDQGLDPKRWNYELKDLKRSLDFIRPNTSSDIEERKYWRESFPNKIKEIIGDDSDLRFHGTPIYNAKAIIESGGIFSSVDINDGYRASTDLSGEISASKVSTINRIFDGWFADMGGYINCLPCGCIFALKNRTHKDRELEEYDAMESVDFRQHPEQLYGIITTQENLSIVRNWLFNTGLNPALVTNFSGFLDRVRQEKNVINQQIVTEVLAPNGNDRFTREKASDTFLDL